MIVTGPTSTARQVRDVERAATSYETHIRLSLASAAPPDAMLFTDPDGYAVTAHDRE